MSFFFSTLGSYIIFCDRSIHLIINIHQYFLLPKKLKKCTNDVTIVARWVQRSQLNTVPRIPAQYCSKDLSSIQFQGTQHNTVPRISAQYHSKEPSTIPFKGSQLNTVPRNPASYHSKDLNSKLLQGSQLNIVPWNPAQYHFRDPAQYCSKQFLYLFVFHCM